METILGKIFNPNSVKFFKPRIETQTLGFFVGSKQQIDGLVPNDFLRHLYANVQLSIHWARGLSDEERETLTADWENALKNNEMINFILETFDVHKAQALANIEKETVNSEA